MNKKSILTGLVLMMALPSIWAGSFPVDDYGASVPVIIVRADGDVMVLDRSYLGSFAGEDRAFHALQVAARVNPGLLEAFQQKLAATLRDGTLSDRQRNDRLRQLYERQLRDYVDQVGSLVFDQGAEETDVPPLDRAWYRSWSEVQTVGRPGAASASSAFNSTITCGDCDLGALESSICGPQQCVNGCSGAASNCVYLEIQPN